VPLTIIRTAQVERNVLVMNSSSPNPVFPREFAPGAFWFSTCLDILVNGKPLHNHNSCFLLIGTTATVLIDTAVPFGWRQLRAQFSSALGGRPLDYIFPTHPEAPHMGNIGPLLQDYPKARLVGDLRNYELYFPDFQDRFQPMAAGDSLDLGGRHLMAVPAAVRDLPNTLWAYEPEHRILFVGDGYPYTHDHEAHQCAMTSAELPDLPRPEDTGVVIESALYWVRHVPAERTIAGLEALLARYPADIVCPSHGGVIVNAAEVTEVFKAGLRRANGLVRA
jgi:flavorubredoxin